DLAMHLLPRLAGYLIAVVGGFAAIILLSPLAAALALLIVPPVSVAGWWLMRRSRAVYPEYRRRVAVMTGHAIESVEATTTLQAYRAERQHQERLQGSNKLVVDGFLAG